MSQNNVLSHFKYSTLYFQWLAQNVSSISSPLPTSVSDSCFVLDERLCTVQNVYTFWHLFSPQDFLCKFDIFLAIGLTTVFVLRSLDQMKWLKVNSRKIKETIASMNGSHSCSGHLHYYTCMYIWTNFVNVINVFADNELRRITESMRTHEHVRKCYRNIWKVAFFRISSWGDYELPLHWSDKTLS